MCLVGNKRAEIARVVPCENNFCTKYAHHLHFCGLQKLNTLNLRHFHPPLNPCNHFSTVLIKTNWYTTSCKYQGCSGLTGISIPNSVTSIGSEAFRGCTSLKNVKISDSVTLIGNRAFFNCSGITDIDIPNGVEKIESSAFSGCTDLTNVVIGKSVKSIGNNAFADCENIEQVVSFVRMIFDINKEVFSNKTYLNATLYVPEGRMKAYQAATGWQNFVYMEEGVPSAIQDIFIDATNESELIEVARCNANGTQISAPIKGLNFIKYSDGTVKKVFVK